MAKVFVAVLLVSYLVCVEPCKAKTAIRQRLVLSDHKQLICTNFEYARNARGIGGMKIMNQLYQTQWICEKVDPHGPDFDRDAKYPVKPQIFTDDEWDYFGMLKSFSFWISSDMSQTFNCFQKFEAGSALDVNVEDGFFPVEIPADYYFGKNQYYSCVDAKNRRIFH